jgi:GntR family transcriptional regulator of arabinose operon
MKSDDLKILGGPLPKNTQTPLFLLIKDRLIDVIRDGNLQIGDKLPSEPDIAVVLGVSRMTANKAILALVSEGWLEREKGRGTYVASPAKRQQLCVSVLLSPVPEDSVYDHYFGPLFLVIQACLSRRGVYTSVFQLTDDVEKRVTEAGARGLLVINPPKGSLSQLMSLSRSVGPTVVLGSSWDSTEHSCIDSDNVLGSALAVNHLADLGHKHIMFFGACGEDSNTVDRLRGFEVAMRLRGLEVRKDWQVVIRGTTRFYPGEEEALDAVLASEDRPTAIVAGGASLSVMTLTLAAKHRLKVPTDLSVIGYDDPPFLNLMNPPVTCVRQPLAAMAQTAVTELLARVANPGSFTRNVILEPDIVVRGSCSRVGDPIGRVFPRE